jgi:hypothetical protein
LAVRDFGFCHFAQRCGFATFTTKLGLWHALLLLLGLLCFFSFLLFAWWPPLFFLVRNCLLPNPVHRASWFTPQIHSSGGLQTGFCACFLFFSLLVDSTTFFVMVGQFRRYLKWQRLLFM